MIRNTLQFFLPSVLNLNIDWYMACILNFQDERDLSPFGDLVIEKMAKKPTYKELEQRIRELELAAGQPGPTDTVPKSENQQLLCIFSSIDQPVYVSDPDTYELLYVNKALKSALGDVNGQKCHQALKNLEVPCAFCTNRHIFGKNLGRQHIGEFHNKKSGRWFHCIAKAIRWPDGRWVRYEMAIDITDRKIGEAELKAEREFSTSIIDNAPTFFVAIDAYGKTVMMNRRMLAALGYSAGEVVGKEYLDKIVPESERDDVARVFLDITTGHRHTLSRNHILSKDGRNLLVEWHGTPIFDTGGALKYFFGIGVDITERRNSEVALQESRERYRRIFESSLDGMVIFDKDGFIRDANPAFHAMHGYSEDKLVGTHGEKLVAPEFHVLFNEFLGISNTDRLFSGRAANIRKDGSRVEIEVRGRVIRLNGKPCILGVARDITERKRSEEAVLFMNTILLTQQETSLDGILVVDEDGKIISFNQRFVEMWNIPSEVIASRSHRQALQTASAQMSDPEEFLVRVRYLYLHRSEKSHEEIGLADGRTFERYSSPMLGPKGEYFGRVWYFRDITERRRRETALMESEKRYRAVVEDMPAMICRFLPDGTLTFANRAYLDNFKITTADLQGINVFNFVPRNERDLVRQRFTSLDRRQPTTTFDHQVTGAKGRKCWQEWTSRALFDEGDRLTEYQAIGRDVTDIRLAREEKFAIEKRLQQAQKMEALGTLAGGIAHDFNNILSAIIGYADMALSDVAKTDSVHYSLKRVLESGFRARDLVKQILAFSRQGEQTPGSVRVGPVIKEVIKLLRASMPTTIDIQASLVARHDVIFADVTQLHQILMNLCTNAGHAMRDKGGVLRIGLNEVDLDAHSASACPGLVPGAYLQLEVGDTGHGMLPEVQDRIYDPFFTTKERGEGTGLGLAVVHGIVKAHNGTINVISKIGEGTTFQVFLPRHETPADPKKPEKTVIPGGGENILFVDDEPLLIEIGQAMLSRLGYNVVAMTDSRGAFEAFSAQPRRFDLVITDQTMPHLTGMELAGKLMHIRPDIPVILCTGFSTRINPEEADLKGIRAFLYKPIILHKLAEAIRQVLDKG